MAEKLGLTASQFKALSDEDRNRMAAKTIMNGWIDMVVNDV